MITTMMKLSYQSEKSKTYAMVMDDEGYKKFREKLKEDQVSEILQYWLSVAVHFYAGVIILFASNHASKLYAFLSRSTPSYPLGNA